MDNHPERRSPFVLCLIVGLALLGCPRAGAAQGTWSVISLPQQPGAVISPMAVAVDAAGNLYIGLADRYDPSGRIIQGAPQILERDTQGTWSAIAVGGTALGQALDVSALTVDAAGNLYVAVIAGIQKRDPQGTWSVIAAYDQDLGAEIGPFVGAGGLAADGANNLYIFSGSVILKRNAAGNWSFLLSLAEALGIDFRVGALAVDAGGSLYVAVGTNGLGLISPGIWKQDAQGNWSLIANFAGVLAADNAGNLYVASGGGIQKRDAHGNWLVIAPTGADLGQVKNPTALAVDTTGNLYVTDTGNNRMLMYTPGP